jgi:hypothetical protein
LNARALLRISSSFLLYPTPPFDVLFKRKHHIRRNLCEQFTITHFNSVCTCIQPKNELRISQCCYRITNNFRSVIFALRITHRVFNSIRTNLKPYGYCCFAQHHVTYREPRYINKNSSFLFYYTTITHAQKVTHTCADEHFVVEIQFTMSRLRLKSWHT